MVTKKVKREQIRELENTIVSSQRKLDEEGRTGPHKNSTDNFKTQNHRAKINHNARNQILNLQTVCKEFYENSNLTRLAEKVKGDVTELNLTTTLGQKFQVYSFETRSKLFVMKIFGVQRNALDFLGIGRSSSSGVWNALALREISTTTPAEKKQSGRFKVSVKQNNPLTYEEAHKPHEIAHRKGWNTYNTENHLEFGIRKSETAMEDIFIRRFLTGTWHNLFVSEIIIKRQHNLIRIAGIVQRTITPRKMYFLIGYTEEMLSYWIQSPIKLELQTVDDKKDVIFKYV